MMVRRQLSLYALALLGAVFVTAASASRASTKLSRRAQRRTSSGIDRVPVGDPFLRASRSEGLLVELRVVARAWKAPNVYDRAHPDFTEDLHKIFDGPRAVSDRPYGHPRRLRDAAQRHGAIMAAPAPTSVKPSGVDVESM
jgi:hypothetical protein